MQGGTEGKLVYHLVTPLQALLQSAQVQQSMQQSAVALERVNGRKVFGDEMVEWLEEAGGVGGWSG